MESSRKLDPRVSALPAPPPPLLELSLCVKYAHLLLLCFLPHCALAPGFSSDIYSVLQCYVVIIFNNLPFLAVCEPHKDLLGALCFMALWGLSVEQVFATWWMNWRMNVFFTSPFCFLGTFTALWSHSKAGTR